MNWKTIKMGIEVIGTVVTLVSTIVKAKEVVTTIKENADAEVERQVRENTGDETFSLKEYEAKKKEESEKQGINTTVTVDVDGIPVKKYIIIKIVKSLFTVFVLASTITFVLFKARNFYSKKTEVLA